MAHTASPASLDRRGLDDERLRGILRAMILARTLETRGFQLNRQGKIPFATGSEGHEGVHAGAALAFARGHDVLVPYYRDMGLCVGVGLSARDVLLSMFARGEERGGGRQFPNHFTNRALGIMSISSIIAGQCSHAVGAAAAMVYRAQGDRAVLCTFGDGATSEGEWHESMNFAAVADLPIVFLCENNEWAISTPLHLQTKVTRIAEKAAAYGMPGVGVDGADPLAVYDVVREALERARSGGGPTLVEATCYRFLAHTTDDDDRTYRTREDVAANRHRDPIPRFERTLLDAGILDESDVAALRADVLAEVDRVTDEVELLAAPSADDLYRNVYAGDHEPWR